MRMKKDLFNLRLKSKLLLFSLFALLAGGVSPAWADAIDLPYSYGFEDESATLTEGWTKYFGTSLTSNNNECGIAGAAKQTGSYGFRFSSYKTNGENAQYLISPELNAPNGVIVTFAWKVSHGMYSESFKVGYSTTDTDVNSFTWDDGTTSNSTGWKNYENTFPAGTKYVAIYYYSNYQGYLYVDDFSFTAPLSGPALAVVDGSTTINSGYTYNFGLATPGKTHYFLLSNPGTEDLGVSVSETGDFGATLSTTTIPAGNTANVALTVTMPDASGSSIITITPAAGSGIDPFVINVSGTIRDPNKVYLDFADGQMPTGWSNVMIGSYGSGWVTADGYIGHASSASSYYLAALTSPRLVFTDGEKLYFDVAKYGSSTYNTAMVKVQTSTDGTSNWTDLYTTPTEDMVYGEWKTETVTMPAGTYFIRFYGGYACLTNIYGGELAPAAPILTFSAPDYSFGMINADKTSASFTVSNTGNAELNGLTVSSNNDNFIVTVANGQTSIDADGGTATFTVTMKANVQGAQSATIIVSGTDVDPKSFDVSGYVADTSEGIIYETFATTLPTRWENTESATWSISNSAAYAGSYTYSSGYHYATLETPKLKITEGQKLAISAKLASSGSYFVKVEGSSDNGETWTAYTKTLDNTVLNTTDYTVVEIDDIPSTVNKLRLVGYYVYVNGFNGFTYDDNDPKMGVYTDANCTVAAATNVTKDFDFQSTAQTETYYIKNDGTGTLTLSLGENPTGFSASLDKTSVAAGEKATLTINMLADEKGYHMGNVIVTATDLGTFTVTVSGVMVDESKFNLDFATKDIPTYWTKNNWSKNASGYAEVGMTSSAMETTTLTATANEQLVVVAKNSYVSEYYTFGVNYREVGTETWNELIAAENLGKEWKLLTATITEAGDYELQFVGSYAQIKHIYGLIESNDPAVTPTGLVASDITYKSATIDWTAGSTETIWQIKYKVADATEYIETGDITIKPYALTGLSANTEYKVSIRSKMRDEYSDWSADYSFTTAELPVINVPTNLAAKNITSTTATMDWTAGSSETVWQIKYGTTSGNLDIESGDISTKPYALSNLNANTTYYVSIRAKVDDVYSAWSEELSFQTPNVGPDPTGGVAAVTETFEEGWANDSWNEGLQTLQNGWGYSGKNTTGYLLNGTYKHEGSYSLAYTSQQNSSSYKYIITPLVKAGSTVTFWYCRASSSNTGYVNLYKATKSGSTYSVNTTVSYGSVSSESTIMAESAEFTIPEDDGDVYVAIRLSRAAIDDFTYTPVDGAAATVSVITGNEGYTTFASDKVLNLTTASLPNGLEAYKAKVVGTTVTLTKLNQTVPANTAILLKGAPYTEYQIATAAEGTAVADNDFLVKEQLTGSSDYIFALKKNSDLEFVRYTGSIDALPAGKAYLSVPASNFTGGARLSISFSDESTGIKTIDNSQVENENCYNLQGQKVQNAKKGGLYIVNGKKVVRK